MAKATSSEAVISGVERYLREVEAPAHLAHQVAMVLRAARAYKTVSEEIAGECVGMDQGELLRIIEEGREILGSPAELLEQAALQGEVKRRIFNEQLLTSSQAGTVLGTRSESNKRQYASKLRLSGELLGIPHKKNRFLYPAFQLEVGRARVRPIVVEVNRLLDALGDPWGVASWWITPSERLGDLSPRELLDTAEEDAIVQLARAELEPIG
jgi:hypothetical protein